MMMMQFYRGMNFIYLVYIYNNIDYYFLLIFIEELYYELFGNFIVFIFIFKLIKSFLYLMANNAENIMKLIFILSRKIYRYGLGNWLERNYFDMGMDL